MTLVLLFLLLCAGALYLARLRIRDAIRALPAGRLFPQPRTPPGSFRCTLEYAWRHARWGCRRRLCALLVGALTVMLSACSLSARTADARVREAVDILADVIDPASELAAQGCITAQETQASEAEAGRITVTQASEAIQQIRVRCRALRAAFDAMRERHAEARQLVEDGALEQAAELVDEIRAEWRQLRDPSMEVPR